MKAYIKYVSGDESVVENFDHLLIDEYDGNSTITKEDISIKILNTGKHFTFVGDRTVSTINAEIAYIEFID